MSKLSVIVPVYNTEKYLRECIDSILAQTFTDFELILVDDGSTDKSGLICDEYARKDNRIRVFHQKNAGVTAARKRGVEMSSGEYVTFVDSDDWIDMDMYRILLAQEPADILICNMYCVTDDDISELKFGIPSGYYDKQRLNEAFYPIMLFDYVHCIPGVSPSLCNKLIRSELIRKTINATDDGVTYGEDAICSSLSVLEADSVHVVEQPLYYYRKNLSSVMNADGEIMFSRLTLLGAELERLLTKQDFDAMHQIYGYLARLSLECIRNELLFHTAVTNRARRNAALAYLRNPLISASLKHAICYFRDWKTRFKMWLLSREMLGLLNILYISSGFLQRRTKRGN